ncbi:MAG: class I SAM-dependent methyltransferase [Aggregatilineales bacterium]
MAESESQSKLPLGEAAAAFDQVAARYDVESTDLMLSRWFRAIVWTQMGKLFPPGAHVLELGCGTGEDAVWNAQRGVYVTASDASPAMLEQTRQKVAAAGVAALVDVQPLDFSQAAAWNLPVGAFDGVYSNYGALNCISFSEWSVLAAALTRAIKPGGTLGVCVIGRVCPWEMLWHGAHLHFKTAFRRLPGHAVAHLDGSYFPVYYPTPGQVMRAFGAHWQQRRLMAVGVFLPPSDLYAGVGHRPALAKQLLRLESATAARWPFKHLGDHYWLELTHR